jgi:glucose uptake protein GlcU
MMIRWSTALQLAGTVLFGVMILLQWRRGHLKGGRLIALAVAWVCFVLSIVATFYGW